MNVMIARSIGIKATCEFPEMVIHPVRLIRRVVSAPEEYARELTGCEKVDSKRFPQARR